MKHPDAGTPPQLSRRPSARPAGDNQGAVAAMIEEWAELQFSPAEIAFQAGIDADLLRRAIADGRHAYGVAYKRGKLRAEATVAKSLYLLAQQGSGPAQRQFLDRVADRASNGEPLESLVASEKRKETAAADIRAMEAAKLRGELIDAASVLKAWVAVATTLKAQFRNLPARLAPLVVGKSNPVEVEALILREVDAILTAVADTPPEVDG